ncbi:hypothetical protein HMPREF9372_1905 [Sporosarcina newyorkensis 2681]|uniref:Uncharacterized protein n=2 Tax=Sporosarcina newyorkensis TaxID=759851 RepID=F9DSX4_9BACL|nr:hypothetical protein HMPREF9372_1905 [Sporosarcina newyorkensis 2681]
MKRTESLDELLAFANATEQQGQMGNVWVQQANYAEEEPIMSDEDVAGREPLQQLRVLLEAGEQSIYFESLFYSAAELEELTSELQPVFEKFSKEVLDAKRMNEKVQALNE